ncbi:hypothetical protein ACNKHM_07250 [Shigella sonnei]
MGYSGAAGTSEERFRPRFAIAEWLDQEPELHEETLRQRILAQSDEVYQRKEEVVGAKMIRHSEKGVMLQTLDSLWKGTWQRWTLSSGIHLRGYAQEKCEAGIQT